MTPRQVARVAVLLEQQAATILAAHTFAGRWTGAYGKEAQREHAELRELAGALRAMAARCYAATEGNKR